ncbi:MAG: methylenetetrahydrofolate--tRNA-(uracil(54)-C(5))-methyltransferase (FADH(2)-oxidizing) TrmFO [Ruthenibacterium sp.]
MQQIRIIGAGLAGCEAALYLADAGFCVELYEQKPHRFSPAHKNSNFAELVCSNSLKAERLDSAGGLLKAEMEQLGSHLLPVARQCRVAAGGALAVDREQFAAAVTALVLQSKKITVHSEEVTAVAENEPDTITLIATGPLTEGAMAREIARLTGAHALSFYDAAAPIVTAESLDRDKIFAASRYDRGTADYLNCPFDKAGYETFYEALVNAQRAELHAFERCAGESAPPEQPDTPENARAEVCAPQEQAAESADKPAAHVTVYEGCMPIEVMAQRGADTMRYGPLRPVGLRNPHTGHRPWANVQLRAEDSACTMYNLVGFQTNLKFGEQQRVFRMIPGLENAEFVRYGVMHRNTFLNSPLLLSGELSLKTHPNVFFAGQITGFEGYMESAASGLLAARAIEARLSGQAAPHYPATAMCGALLRYIGTQSADFQPMGANMGILPPLAGGEFARDKRARYLAIAQRAVDDLSSALQPK